MIYDHFKCTSSTLLHFMGESGKFTFQIEMNNPYKYVEDGELARQISSGNHCAFEELFHRYKERLYGHAYRMIPDTEICNDIIQDIFIAVWTKRRSFIIKTSVVAYLTQAVKNRVLDHISHQKVVEHYLEEIYDFEKNGRCYTEESVLERELITLIDSEKSELPPRTKEIFELNREQQLSYKEIGQLLDISEKTAKKQVHNALRYLRAKLTTLLFSFLILFF